MLFCLAFPLLPSVAPPEKTRQVELDAVQVPVLVIQGKNVRFGMPAPAGSRRV